jgi:hypothetical protein
VRLLLSGCKNSRDCSEVLLASRMTDRTSRHIALEIWDRLGGYKIFNIPLNYINVYLVLHGKKASQLIP